ncbi:MAG: hypothetical protein H6658_02120 [Ardenticatenaceae bacterium]|nr:hypothetical protein [Ardenticatenaceae bacterium]
MHNFLPQVFYAPDNGSGGGDAAAPATANGRSTETPDGGDDASSSETADGEGKEKTFTQAELEAALEKRLKRQEAKMRKEMEEAQRKREAEELEASQEWQTLAQKRQSQIQDLSQRVAELEPLAERAEKYEAALTGYRDELLKGVPDHIQELLADKDIADQLTWLTSNAAKLKKRPSDAADNGLAPTPNASPDQHMSADDRRKVAYRPRM